MSQNLAADVVDKIQIIDKFNNNKLLRGLRRSDDKVINITLKDNRKSLLFGQVNLGLGNDERTNNSMNLFTFIKKFKMITFGSFNTIGQQSTADRMLSVVLNEGSEFQKLKALVSDQNNALINIDRTPSVQIGSQNIRFNKSALLSTHFVTRFHETTKITGSVTLANDNNFVYTDNDYQYLLKDSIFKLKETNEFNRKPLVFESHLNIEADLGEKTLIQNSSTFRKSSLTNQANTIANLNKIQNTLNDNGIYFNNSFDLTHRINENKAMLTNIQFIYDNKNQVFDINQNDARELPFNKVLTDKIEQLYNKPLIFISFNSQLFTARNKNQISIGLGGVNRSEKFSTDLNVYQNNTAIVLSDTFSNVFSFNQQNLYGYLNMKTEIKGFQLFGDLSSGFYQTKQIYTSSVFNLKKGFYALPTMGFRKEFGKKSLFGTYTFNFNLPQVADLATGLIVTDYRSMQRGSSVTIPSNNQTIIANYVFGSYSDNFMLHTNLIATQSAKGYRSALLFEKDFNVSEKIENTFTNQNISLSMGIDYYSPSIYTRFKIRPHVSYSSYQNSLNGSDLRETKTFSKSINLSVRSAYLKGFNYHLGSTLSQNDVNTYLGENKLSNNNLSIGSFLDVYLRFSQRLNMKLESEYFYTSTAKSPPQYYSFFNTAVYYDVVKSKLSLIFTVRNILNTRNFVNTYVNDYSVYTNQVKLLPRFFLIEGNFKF